MAPDGQVAPLPAPPSLSGEGGRGRAPPWRSKSGRLASRIACSRLDRFVRPVSGRCAAVAELAALVGGDAGADPCRPADMRQDLRVGAVPSR